jgi:hypothetical protein
MQVLNDNSHRLGNINVSSTAWPESPATQVRIFKQPSSSSSSFCQDPTPAREAGSRAPAITSAIQDTEKWVKEKLCGIRLCPHPASMTRAAVGLESVGMAEGPIVIQHSKDEDAIGTDAALLSLAFWKGATELATVREEKVATFLIIAPTSLDNDFVEFTAVFDELIEPSVQAVGAESIVGRALFHPQYNASLIGHDNIFAGHALPAKMVQGLFVEDQYAEAGTNIIPDLDAIALANDAV